MSPSRPRRHSLRYHQPLDRVSDKVPPGYDQVCRVCNHFRYSDDFEQVHMAEGRRTPRTRISGNPDFYVVNIFSNQLLRDGEADKVDDDDRLRDCPYCRLIFDALNSFFTDGVSNWREDAPQDSKLCIEVKVRPGRSMVIDCQGAFCVIPHSTLVQASLEVFTLDRGSLTASDFPCPELAFPEPEDRSQHLLGEGFIQSWFWKCSAYVDAMKQCFVTPNRLLYVDWENDEVILWECLSSPPGLPNTKGQLWYATLSHCWLNTDPQAPKLLSSNIDEWKLGRPISSLPAAIRDAMRVTHLNSLQYLFIESLCIVQDSHDDLRMQTPMVGQYFRDSSLTIAAASAEGPDDSFLHPPKKDWVMKQLEFVAPNGSATTLMLRRKFSRPEASSDLVDRSSARWSVSPGSFRRAGSLYGRHWYLNEVLLGTRVIHFTSRGIMCQCRRHEWCSKDTILSDYDRWQWSIGMPDRHADPYDYWYQAVEFLTSCDKLRGEDRLAKVSALAGISDMATRDRYFAGLWWKSITKALLWEVKLPPGPQSNTKKIALRYTKQKAPTFSWASVDAPVVWRDGWWNAWPLANIAGAGSIPTHPENPYGSIEGGWIHLDGYLLKCEVRQTLTGTGGGRWQYALLRGKDDPKAKPYRFVGDGALAMVKAKGAMERLRRKYASQPRRRWAKNKGRKGLSRQRDNPHRSRAYLTRNIFEFKQQRLGRRTTRGVAFVFPVRQRGNYVEEYNAIEYDKWDGLVLTRSMRYPGAFERIGCIRNMPSTVLALATIAQRVTIV